MPFNLEGAGHWYRLAGLPEPHHSDPPLLVASGADVAETVAWCNARLADLGSGWRVEPEDGPATRPVVTALVVRRPELSLPDEPVLSVSDVLALLKLRTGPSPWPGPVLAVGSFGFDNPGPKPGAVRQTGPLPELAALVGGPLGRIPVTASLPPPARRPLSALPGGRRPVVALLDTAVDPHAPGRPAPWLGDPDPGPDGVWADAGQYGWQRGPARLRPPETASFRSMPKCFGHGTFSAGLIRQVAPDARILSVPVVDDDGTTHIDQLINAFGWLHEQRTADPTFVDVVCCPITVTANLPDDALVLGWLRAVLGALGGAGVPVVVPAGNDGSPVPTFPGAFTALSVAGTPDVPVVTVGALNPDGSDAYYSNHGDWVQVRRPGSALISLMPVWDGDEQPPVRGSAGVGVDPDAFRGWARWSGTSFACALHAGELAAL
ncbi:S8 family serine peptidase [Dactylosporangium sp. NPDC006015]|uniref:S8 family peptidase n=1 Tax=Dactylosporangium sp. NPDC006015 TaxID=3154576 RepID=UPI0033A9C673